MFKRMIAVGVAALTVVLAGCTQLDEDVVKKTIVDSLNEQVLCNSSAKALAVERMSLEQDGDSWSGTAMVAFKSEMGKRVSVPMNITVKLMDSKSGDVWVESNFFNPEAASRQLGVE